MRVVVAAAALSWIVVPSPAEAGKWRKETAPVLEAQAAAEFGTLAAFAETHTRFEPYKAVVLSEQSAIGAEVKAWLGRLDQTAKPLQGYTSVFSPALRAKPYQYDYTEVYFPGEVLAEVRQGCINDLRTQGWAVCSTGYPREQVQFGSYTVPAAFFAWVGLSNNSVSLIKVHRHDFTIKGQGANQSAPAPVAPQPPAVAAPAPAKDTPAERLTQLKALLEAGLIDQAAYDEKLKEILKEL